MYAINGTLPSIINIIEVISIKGLLKQPIDSLQLEKPPVANVVIECVILSKRLIPKSLYKKDTTLLTDEIPNDVIAVRTDLPADLKQQIYDILATYIATDEGAAMMDEIYGWTDLVPAVNSEFDVVREAAEEFGLYDD